MGSWKRGCVEHSEAGKRRTREERSPPTSQLCQRSSEIRGILLAPEDIIATGQFFCLWYFLIKINFNIKMEFWLLWRKWMNYFEYENFQLPLRNFYPSTLPNHQINHHPQIPPQTLPDKYCFSTNPQFTLRRWKPLWCTLCLIPHI